MPFRFKNTSSVRGSLPSCAGTTVAEVCTEIASEVITMATINETETIDPDLKSMERRTISSRLLPPKDRRPANRGEIAGDLFETIDSEICLSREAIYRHGLYRAELGRARKLVKSKELVKADVGRAARMTKPEMREAWELEIRVCESLEQLEDAIGLCNEESSAFRTWPPFSSNCGTNGSSNCVASKFVRRPSRSGGLNSVSSGRWAGIRAACPQGA